MELIRGLEVVGVGSWTGPRNPSEWRVFSSGERGDRPESSGCEKEQNSAPVNTKEPERGLRSRQGVGPGLEERLRWRGAVRRTGGRFRGCGGVSRGDTIRPGRDRRR